MLLEHCLLVAFFDTNRFIKAKPIFTAAIDIGTAPIDRIVLILAPFGCLAREGCEHQVTQAVGLVTSQDMPFPWLDVAPTGGKGCTFEDVSNDPFVDWLRQKPSDTAARADGLVHDIC